MRYSPLLLLSGLITGANACDPGATEASPCEDGFEMCGSRCVTRGACITGTASGGTGQTSTKDPEPISSPDCTDSSSSAGNLDVQYAAMSLSASAEKSYYLMTNWWGKYTDQSISYDGLSLTIHNPSNLKTDNTNPIGFPTIFIGNYSGNETKGSNLPKRVGDLTTVPTVFSTNILNLGTPQDSNATYDVWFTASPDTLSRGDVSPRKGGAYLMVWLYKPSSRSARGSIRSEVHHVEGVDGINWNVWVDGPPNSDPLCISYVPTKPMNGLAFDLNHFIKDAVQNNYGITNDMYLSVIFAGFEVWSGGDGLKINNFCANVN